jgi:hypothetical protein
MILRAFCPVPTLAPTSRTLALDPSFRCVVYRSVERNIAEAIREAENMAGKAGICSCCASPHRREIDLALVARVPCSVIGRRFEVSGDSVERHGKNHLSAVQVAALASAMRPSAIDLEALQRSEGESLLGQLLAQRATLQVIGAAAFEAKNYQAAVAAERAVTNSLDLLSRVLGLIINRHETKSTTLLVSADYLELRACLIEALRPFPEAAHAVGIALRSLEDKAAADIKAKANGSMALIEGRAEPMGSPPVRLNSAPLPAGPP